MARHCSCLLLTDQEHLYNICILLWHYLRWKTIELSVMNVEYFHFLTQTQETMSHIYRKTGDTAVTLLALFKCPHCDSHFSIVPGQMQAASTHKCPKISMICTLLK